MYEHTDKQTVLTFNYDIVVTSAESDGVKAEVYGIKAEMYEGGRLTGESSVDDIFCSRSEADEFISLLRENGVDPCNLHEVAEDWLQR